MLHLFFLYSYLLIGIVMMLLHKELPLIYLFCLAFCSFKVITNYRVCSVAYLECKFRDIKREDSIMNNFLDPIVDVRYSNHVYLMSIIAFVILTYNYVFQDKYKDFINLF